jgi:hypothetical protein
MQINALTARPYAINYRNTTSRLAFGIDKSKKEEKTAEEKEEDKGYRKGLAHAASLIALVAVGLGVKDLGEGGNNLDKMSTVAYQATERNYMLASVNEGDTFTVADKHGSRRYCLKDNKIEELPPIEPAQKQAGQP